MKDEKRSLGDFVLGAKETLLKRVRTYLDLTFDRSRDRQFAGQIRDAFRKLPSAVKPYREQFWRIVAMVKGFRHYRALGLVGEMGVGKTLCAGWTAWIAGDLRGRAPRILVLCPPTLISTWEEDLRKAFGHRVTIINLNGQDAILQLSKLRDGQYDPAKTLFCLMGINRGKLGPRWKRTAFQQHKVVQRRDRLPVTVCDFCSNEVVFENAQVRTSCPACGNPLWGPDCSSGESFLSWSRSVATRKADKNLGGATGRQVPGNSQSGANTPGGIRRWPAAQYVTRKMRLWFDLLVADEVHMLKGGDTIQGAMLGQLATACRRTLVMTGTLSGGRSSDVYYLLQRVFALNMRGPERELLPPFHGVQQFVEKYGVVEKVYRSTDVDDAATGRRYKETTQVKEKPGCSPELISLFLPYIVNLRITDIADQMPPYEELVDYCPMHPGVAGTYKLFEAAVRTAAIEHMVQGDMTVLGQMLSNLLGWPDRPQLGAEVKNRNDEVVAWAPEVQTPLTPKDERLVELVQENKAQGRRCLVYYEYSKKWGMGEYLKGVLERAGLTVAHLVVTVPSEKRLKWIEDRFGKKAKVVPDVLLCHPRLIEVGLNLRQFPEILFAQTGYSTFTLRQASRRSWRPGQDQDVRVRFMLAEGSMQETAMRLIATKLQASLVLEGELVDGGLSALSDMGDSLVVALAKALVNGGCKGSDGPITLQRFGGVAGPAEDDDFDYDFAYRGPVIKHGRKAAHAVERKPAAKPPVLVSIEAPPVGVRMAQLSLFS